MHNGTENEELPALLERVARLEEAAAAIRSRNRRVELEKAWEQSRTRTVAIVALTYAVMCLIFYSLGTESVFSNAVIPTMGYFLSTQSLPILKRRWIAQQK